MILKHKTKAITLVELLVSIGVVMATIGMVATFIKFQQPNLELSSAAHDLKGALNEARQLALTTQESHGVKFLLANNSYEIRRGNATPITLSTAILPVSVAYESIGAFTDNTVSFNAAGGAREAGTIILQNSLDQTKQIIISPSGYVHIE